MNIFGFLLLLSFAAAYYFYATWFFSVWCFLAAILSVTVLLQVLNIDPKQQVAP